MSAPILFVVFSGAGHLNPMIATAQRLEARGREVVMFSLEGDVSEICARAGLRARCLRSTSVDPTAPRKEGSAPQMRSARWLTIWARMQLLAPVPTQVAQLRELLRTLRPAVVALDPLAYAGAIAAELEGVVWAGLSTGLQALQGHCDPNTSEPDRDELSAEREQLAEQHGVRLRFQRSEVLSPTLRVCFLYEALLPSALRSGQICVGAALPTIARDDADPFPWERLPSDRPIVYVAFGSHLPQPAHVYEALWSALDADEACFVVAMKQQLDEPFAAARPAHVIAVRHAPQLRLLERASVIVHHGGANSVMEAIARGVPQLVVPIGYDQPLLARLVADAGVGATLDAEAIDPASARAALCACLPRDAPARARARAIAETQPDGAMHAAELLLALG